MLLNSALTLSADAWAYRFSVILMLECPMMSPYDDRIFRQLADIDRRNNIPNTSPELDFDEMDFEDYMKDKWNRGL